jgi:Spy/CpxP family protein refolding chaperone
MGAMLLDGPMLGALRRLNLSDAQRARMRTILVNARNGAAQERGNQARGAAARADLGAILNPGDPNYARAVQAAKDRAVDRIQRATQTQQALYNVLTSAQKAQLSQMFAQQRARMQQRAAQLRARRAQRGGGGPAGPAAHGRPDAQGQPGAPGNGGGQ